MKNIIVLIEAILIFSAGVGCYFNRKHTITEENKLYIYRPSDYNILLKCKLFKNDLNFNYFSLIPFILSILISISLFTVTLLSIVGINALQFILFSKAFQYTILGVISFLFLYYIIIDKIVVSNNYIYDKEELKAYKKKIAEKRKKDELKHLAKLEKKAQRQKNKR